jgi:hypothetical protein
VARELGKIPVFEVKEVIRLRLRGEAVWVTSVITAPMSALNEGL